MLGLVVQKSPETGLQWWIPLILLVGVLGGGIVALLWRGRGVRGNSAVRVLTALRAATGLPAWSAASLALVLWSLLVALLGFAWDVSWHADIGRDKALFTPPHVLILVGLSGIGLSALTAIATATWERADVGLRLGRTLRVPWSSIPLGVMGLGAVVGFPLDSYWHSVYGIDVTMWSPTHLLMIGGASLTPIAAWLLLAEADVAPVRSRTVRLFMEMLATSTLIGLSTFQLEFDMGIPQWQALYQPALIAVAMGIGLLAAREALGPGGAVRATLGFLGLRAIVAVLVGPAFGLTLERFPLYLGGALAVEAVYALGGRVAPLARVLIAGLLVGTVGLAAEWGWTHAWGLEPWQPRLLAWWWVVVGLALVGALIGTALGRAVTHSPRLVPFPVVGAALVVLVALIAVPYPRSGADVVATVTAREVGPSVPTITRDGVATFEGQLTADITISPAGVVDGADVFRVVAWQGGDIVLRPPARTGPGRYTISDPFPQGADWKSIVFLEDGSAVAAVPIDFPADAQYGLKPIHAPTTTPRTARFEAASTYLMRESHSGSALPAILCYATFLLMALAWGAALLGVATATSRRLTAELPGRPASQRSRITAGR